MKRDELIKALQKMPENTTVLAINLKTNKAYPIQRVKWFTLANEEAELSFIALEGSVALYAKNSRSLADLILAE